MASETLKRLIAVERGIVGVREEVAGTNQRLGHLELLVDLTNTRLEGVERLMGVLVEEFRGLRADLTAVADLRRRVEVLEARAQG